MNIQRTSSSPAFGMAFRLSNYKAAKALAQKFHSYSDPAVAEKYFVKDVVKPLENVKSDVLYDGNDVFVIDGFTKDKYKLLDAFSTSNGNRNSYMVEQNGIKSKLDIYGDDKSYAPMVEDKFTTGVRIAKFLDFLRKPGSETVDETAGRLFSLFKD